MREFARVREDDHYVRDLNSNAILSKDRAGYELRRRLKKSQLDKNTLEKTVEELLARVAALEEKVALLNG